MQNYILATSTKINFQQTTGWDIRGVSNWIGNTLIRDIAGNFLNILYEYRYWFIALLIMAGIIGIVKRTFSLYKTKV